MNSPSSLLPKLPQVLSPVVLPTPSSTHSSMSVLPSVLISELSRSTMVSLTASRRPLLRTVLSHSTMVLDHPPLVLLFTEVSSSVSKIPSRPSTHGKRRRPSLVSSPSSSLPRLPCLAQDLLPIHLIPSRDVSKTRPPSQRPNRSTPEWETASPRS